MSYNRNDIVKINTADQSRYFSSAYSLNCPYVRIVRHYDSRSPTAMVYTTLLSSETGRLHPNFAMTLNLEDSVLVKAAYVDEVTDAV